MLFLAFLLPLLVGFLVSDHFPFGKEVVGVSVSFYLVCTERKGEKKFQVSKQIPRGVTSVILVTVEGAEKLLV